MSAARVLRLDQIVEGTGATVDVRVDADGSTLDAWFAMESMPRVEPLLLGRPVSEIPGIVERICGICPVAHHLAGIRTLEAMAGIHVLTPTAEAMRRLLHYGAVVQTHARALTDLDAIHARDVSGFARRVVAAAGADSHVPLCAVPGGVRSPLPVARRDELMAQVGSALESAVRLLELVEARPGREASTYGGHDLALVDRVGALDLYGDRIRAVAPDGSVAVEGVESDDWVDLVAESRPGSAAPRPYLRALGTGRGAYRVGPVAQLRAALCLNTPLAEEARQGWSAAGGDATWARIVVTVHAVEVLYELLSRPELVVGPVLVPVVTRDSATGRVASGWVDGARGLLVHTYRTDGAGLLSGATITTPTSQNETWLSDLLLTAMAGSAPIGPDSRDVSHLREPLETAIREADPCLPCMSTPRGRMQVRVQLHDEDPAILVSWLLEGTRRSGGAVTGASREGR